MPPRKRNAPSGGAVAEEPVPKRRSLRSATRSQAQPTKPQQTVKEEDIKPEPKPAKSEKKPAKKPTKTKPDPKNASEKTPKIEKVDKAIKKDQTDKPNAKESSETPDVDSIPTRNPNAPKHDGEWYWLMKAEPETRLENGIDVRFSIDDLRAKEKPEGWDGKSPSHSYSQFTYSHPQESELIQVGLILEPLNFLELLNSLSFSTP
ncbi:thymocyte nuclear protein 1 [Ilyonectria robusta]